MLSPGVSDDNLGSYCCLWGWGSVGEEVGVEGGGDLDLG